MKKQANSMKQLLGRCRDVLRDVESTLARRRGAGHLKKVDDNDVAKRHCNGESVAELAALFKVSQTTIRKALRRSMK